MRKTYVGIDEDVYAIFDQYSWPGNIRELANVIDRAIAVAETPLIRVCDLPAAMQETVKSQPVLVSNGKNLAELEHDCLLQLLTETRGNLREVARRMGVARSTVYNKVKNMRIPVENYRS